MAQDFAKRSKSRKKKPPPKRFSLGSFLLGVFTGVGLFLLGAYGPEVLKLRNLAPDAKTAERPQQQPETASETAPEAASGTEAPADAEAPQDLEFVFRDLLGTDSVDADVSAYEADMVMPQKSPGQTMQYLLQSGSFQIKADAESRRGTLLLLNMPANIVEANIDNKIWYRVIVGPYAQRAKAQQAVSRLRAEDISSIWLERPLT